MPIEFRCPTCDRTLRTSDDRAGATAKCPQCGSPVIVPTPASVVELAEPALAGAESVDCDISGGDFSGGDFSGGERREIVCPMCGAANDATAPRCLACGEALWAEQGGIAAAESLAFGSIWGEAWAQWTANIGLCVASAAISGGALFAAYMAFLLLMFVVFGFAAAVQDEDVILVGLFGVMAAGYLIMFLVYSLLLVGLSQFSLQVSRERSVGLGAMAPSASKVASSLIATLVVSLALLVTMLPGGGLYALGLSLSGDADAIGALLAVVGYAGIFVGWGLGWTFFWPVHYVIADEPSFSLAAIGRGVRMALRNLWLSFLLALVHTGLMIAGFLTCYVGLLFAAPLSFVLFAVAYNRCARRAAQS